MRFNPASWGPLQRIKTANYRGWSYNFDRYRPVTGQWRAEQHGVSMCAGSEDALKRMIDSKATGGNAPDRRHGGAYDRGSADAYYHRARDPHYYKGATYASDRVEAKDMTPAEIEAYNAGYNGEPDRKDWGI